MYCYKHEKLERFYHTELGNIVHKNIAAVIASMWPDVHDQTILGIGFTANYLSPFVGHNNIVASIITAKASDYQPSSWIIGGVNAAMIASGVELPLADNVIDRVIVTHLLEYSGHLGLILREIWRILKPGGKALIVAPNKLSMWSYVKKSPFKSANLFTLRQLHQLLNDSMFATTSSSSALFMSLDIYKLMPDLSSAFENWGSKWLCPFGGVLVVEAEKLICISSQKPSFKTNQLSPWLGKARSLHNDSRR